MLSWSLWEKIKAKGRKLTFTISKNKKKIFISSFLLAFLVSFKEIISNFKELINNNYLKYRLFNLLFVEFTSYLVYLLRCLLYFILFFLIIIVIQEFFRKQKGNFLGKSLLTGIVILLLNISWLVLVPIYGNYLFDWNFFPPFIPDMWQIALTNLIFIMFFSYHCGY